MRIKLSRKEYIDIEPKFGGFSVKKFDGKVRKSEYISNEEFARVMGMLVESKNRAESY